MSRPVRPVALVLLTACMLYPGLTMVFQGLYPFCTGEHFTLVAKLGSWFDLAHRIGLPLPLVSLLKAGLGGAWMAGVLGLWAGDGRAYPLALLAAAGSLLYPGGPMIMGVIGLIALLGFRESPEVVMA